jgi:DnaJ family protein A protein 2
METGDVIIVVNEQPHALFKRKGADLFIEKEITLLEALTGVNFVIDFLDGTKFKVTNKPGEVIKPDSIMTIEEKGLPFHKSPYKFGNLFILFRVEFPETMNSSQMKEVSTSLAGMKTKKNDEEMDEAETVKLISFKDDHKNTHC